MIYYFDTNTFIRFFSGDDLKKANLVEKIIEDDNNHIKVPDVVFPEIEYVLTGNVYNRSRNDVIDSFNYIISQHNIYTSAIAKIAISFYKSTTLDCADCFVLAESMGEELFTFDKKLQKLHKSLNQK